jgi:hypothetical protein
MIILLDPYRQEAVDELAPIQCGQLITPAGGHRNAGVPFAVDNGAFSGFEPRRFEAILEREKKFRKSCIFVAAPDIVSNARRTIEAFQFWYPKIKSFGDYPVALVAQDGIEDLPIPWPILDAISIGGSTKWKDSNAAADVVRCAKIVDKWVHVGRVNCGGRYEKFVELGADSCDGRGVSMYSRMRQSILNPAHPLLDGIEEQLT